MSNFARFNTVLSKCKPIKSSFPYMTRDFCFEQLLKHLNKIGLRLADKRVCKGAIIL